MIMKNSFIVNAETGDYYNQISGTEVLAEFKEDYVENMYVTGNSRSIYYLKDEEGAFIGLNKTDCSRMRFYFQQDSLTDVRFYAEPTSVLTPVARIKTADLYLDGFAWNIDIKPVSIDDLLNTSKSVKRGRAAGNVGSEIPIEVPSTQTDSTKQTGILPGNKLDQMSRKQKDGKSIEPEKKKN